MLSFRIWATHLVWTMMRVQSTTSFNLLPGGRGAAKHPALRCALHSHLTQFDSCQMWPSVHFTVRGVSTLGVNTVYRRTERCDGVMVELYRPSWLAALDAGSLQGQRAGICRVCNSGLLTGQWSTNRAGHSGASELGVVGPQCQQRQRSPGRGGGGTQPP